MYKKTVHKTEQTSESRKPLKPFRPLPDKQYDIIYADPPWEYRQIGARGTAEQHYDTMTTENICSLPIQSISTDRTVCFLWATFPNIDQALKVMQAWGFIYKTAAFVWVKKNRRSNTNFWGMGAYTRANAEVCLLGISRKTKAGQCVKSHKVHQIIESPVESHSEKPGVVRSRIVELLGDIPRIELFAREKADGWDVWGNEAKRK